MLLEETDRQELWAGLRKFIDRHCIFRCHPDVQYCPGIPKGKIPSSSPGQTGTWQFYLRNLTQDSDMVSAATLLIMDMMDKNGDLADGEPFQFAGLETSSTPLISALQMQLRRYYGKSINSFSVRKERKKYGIFNFVDGIPNKSRVCVIDDVINSGKSLDKVADVANFELDLLLHSNSYFIINLCPERPIHAFDGTVTKLNSLFLKGDFDLKFSEEKYWIPFDCDKSFNKRPDYF
jgi:hypothetical protein